MGFLSQILTSLIFLILVLPGVILAYSILGRRSRAETFFVGTLIGLVGIIYLARLFPLEWLPLVLGVLYTATAALGMRELRSGKSGQSRTGIEWPVWLVATVAYLLWSRASAGSILPAGPDPMYHMILVGKILVTGHVPTNWLPFESIPVNYPTGSHLFVAMISWLSPGMVPHHAFLAVFAPMAFLTAGMIYLLGKAIFDDWRGPLLGALLWTTVAHWGGMDYLRWGGLPNMMGMLLLMGAVWAVATQEGARRWGLAGWFGAGLVLIHHHSALTAAGVFLAILTVNRVAMGSLGKSGKEIIYGGLLAVLLLPATVFGKLWDLLSGRASATSTFTFHEFFLPIQDLAPKLGFEVSILGLLGLGFIIYNLRDQKSLLIPAWTAGLLGMLAFFGYIYRAFAFGFYGEFYAAFTPSRFLTDLTYPLCLAGGYYLGFTGSRPKKRAILLALAGLAYVGLKLSSGPELFSNQLLFGIQFKKYIAYPLLCTSLAVLLLLGHKRLLGTVTLAVIFISLTAVGMINSMKISGYIGKTISPVELDDFNKLRETIPPDALVVNHVAIPRDRRIYGWIPYWTWRECTSTPIPASEARLDSSITFKRTWLEPIVQEQIIWAHIEGRPVVALIPPFSTLKMHGFEPILESKFRKAFMYDPAKH